MRIACLGGPAGLYFAISLTCTYLMPNGLNQQSSGLQEQAGVGRGSVIRAPMFAPFK